MNVVFLEIFNKVVAYVIPLSLFTWGSNTIILVYNMGVGMALFTIADVSLAILVKV